MKTCTKCGVEKDETEFYQHKKGTLYAACKVCVNTKNRRNQKANPGREAARSAAYYVEHKEHIAARAKKAREDNPEKAAARAAADYAGHKEARKAQRKSYRVANKDLVSARNKKWLEDNPEKHAAIRSAWRKKNAKKVAAQCLAWQRAHPEAVAAASAAWQKANPEKVTAATAKRRAAQLKATPSWANDFFIEEIYDLAQRRTKATGFEWQVDHIVPLRGKSVRGLHVENNLRVIPAVINLAKGNRHWPGMPAEHQRSPT